MTPIDTDATVPPLLQSTSALSISHSPLSPNTADSPSSSLSSSSCSPCSPMVCSENDDNEDNDSSCENNATNSKNRLSLTLSPTQSHIRRIMLLPKSPTSPTIWKRQHYFHYSSSPSSPNLLYSNNNHFLSNNTNIINNAYDYYSCKHNKSEDHRSTASNLRVLLVDDNEVNLQVLSKTLKIHMADIFEHMDLVSSGEHAIEKLRQHFYDLILMDIDMPGLSGIDAATWIRRGHQLRDNDRLAFVLTQNRRVPIVAVTTNMSLEWKKAYLKVGMNGCLSKPISPFILRHSLTQVLMYGSYWDYSN